MRGQAGFSITELIVACVLLAFAFAAIGEIVVLTTNANTKLTNCIDGATGANLFLSRLAADVKSSYSINASADGTSLTLTQPALYTAAAQGNPDFNGLPLVTMAASGSTCFDTVQYQVVIDAPAAPGLVQQYIIQETRTLGTSIVDTNHSSRRTQIETPQTVLRGLVGPRKGNPVPSVFQSIPLNPPTGTAPIGTSVNIELVNPVPNNGINTHNIAVHSDMTLRCAKNAPINTYQ